MALLIEVELDVAIHFEQLDLICGDHAHRGGFYLP